MKRHKVVRLERKLLFVQNTLAYSIIKKLYNIGSVTINFYCRKRFFAIVSWCVVTISLSYKSLILQARLGAYLIHPNDKLLAFPTNFRLLLKWIKIENTVVYWVLNQLRRKKFYRIGSGFIENHKIEDHGAYIIKHFN